MAELADTRTVEAAVPADCRPMRADAQRNRRRILEAAEEVFAKDGIAVPVDMVAERAGVGVGTLYRHFPTKEALFEAIVLDKIDELIESAQRAEGDDPAEIFFGFLMRLADQVSLKHDLLDAMGTAGVDFKSRCGDRVQVLKERLDGLRQSAVESGQLRGGVTVEQIMGLVMGACRAAAESGPAAGDTHVMVGIVCDGLRAPA